MPSGNGGCLVLTSGSPLSQRESSERSDNAAVAEGGGAYVSVQCRRDGVIPMVADPLRNSPLHACACRIERLEVFSHFIFELLACEASYCSLGRIVTVRHTWGMDLRTEPVQARTGLTVLRERILILITCCRWCGLSQIAGVQLLLLCPSGQSGPLRVYRDGSRRVVQASKPVPTLACH